VGVANDLAASVESLRSRVVGACGVGESTQLHVGNIDLDLESLEWREIIEVLGVDDYGRDHPVDRRDLSHNDTVARSITILKTVGHGLARTEVDEVGVVSSGVDLAIGSHSGVLTR